MFHKLKAFLPSSVLHFVAISCGRPLADDQAIIHGDVYTYKSFVAYTCPLGYKRRSAAFLQCLSSGNWSSNPECYADGLH